MGLYYVDELAADLWASLNADLAKDADPATVACTVNPNTARTFKVGDLVVFNDETKNPDVGYLRSYECAQIVGPGSDGEVVPTGDFQLQRAYPGVDPGFATFGTLQCTHKAGIRFFKLDRNTFTLSVKKGFFRTPGIPARVEAKLPSACVVAMLVAWRTTSATVRSRSGRSRTTANRSCPVTGRVTAARTRSRSPARSRSRTTWSSRCACATARRSGASMRADAHHGRPERAPCQSVAV